MESITTSSYSVHFNQKAFAQLKEVLSAKAYSKVFVLVDENTKADCLPVFKNEMSDGFSFGLIEIKSGEVHKFGLPCQKWMQIGKAS